MPPTANNLFFLSAVRNEDGDFEFKDGSKPIETSFTSLKIVTDKEAEFCVTAKFDPASASSLSLYESNCNINSGIVCRMWKNVASNCNVPFKKQVNIGNNVSNIFTLKLFFLVGF